MTAKIEDFTFPRAAEYQPNTVSVSVNVQGRDVTNIARDPSQELELLINQTEAARIDVLIAEQKKIRLLKDRKQMKTKSPGRNSTIREQDQVISALREKRDEKMEALKQEQNEDPRIALLETAIEKDRNRAANL